MFNSLFPRDTESQGNRKKSLNKINFKFLASKNIIKKREGRPKRRSTNQRPIFPHGFTSYIDNQKTIAKGDVIKAILKRV